MDSVGSLNRRGGTRSPGSMPTLRRVPSAPTPSQNHDIEQPPDPPKQYLEGFPSLSALLSSDPDLQVYRRFNRLASRNLLYLQAEVLDLEARLKESDAEDLAVANAEEDGGDWMEVKLNARCWEVFRERAERGEEKERERMKLIRELRGRMAEYRGSNIKDCRRSAGLTDRRGCPYPSKHNPQARKSKRTSPWGSD